MPPVSTGFLAGTTVLLGLAVVSDIRRRRIPNLVSGALFAGAEITRAWIGGPVAALSGLAACAFILALLWTPWRRHGIGGGDVKLSAAAGAVVGIKGLPLLVLATGLAGGLASAACYLASSSCVRTEIRANLFGAALMRELPSPASHQAGRVRVPYAVAIAAGVFTVVLAGQ